MIGQRPLISLGPLPEEKRAIIKNYWNPGGRHQGMRHRQRKRRPSMRFLIQRRKGLDQYLHFDGYRKVSFLDHFIAEPMDFESFRRCQYQEEGDFIKEPYEMEVRRKGKRQEVLFSRSGGLRKGGGKDPIKIEKSFSILTHQTLVRSGLSNDLFRGEDEKQTSVSN